MNSCVLDSSAVLAYLHREPGCDAIAKLLDQARVSAVNIAEVATKLAGKGATEPGIRRAVRALRLEIVAFDETLAYRAALLRQATRGAVLSLGDRACLATAQVLGVPAVTMDRSWADLKLDVEVQVIR